MKISDLNHYVLFTFTIEDTGAKTSTTQIQDILTITDENQNQVESFYVGNKIILSDDITYEIISVSVSGIPQVVGEVRGVTEETDQISKKYILALEIGLRPFN